MLEFFFTKGLVWICSLKVTQCQGSGCSICKQNCSYNTGELTTYTGLPLNVPFVLESEKPVGAIFSITENGTGRLFGSVTHHMLLDTKQNVSAEF